MAAKLKQDHVRVTPVKTENDDHTGEGNKTPTYLHGRGAQINTKNRFLKNESSWEHFPIAFQTP